MIGRTAVLLQTDFCSTSIESFNYLCVRVCATTKKVLLHEKFIINRKALEVKKKYIKILIEKFIQFMWKKSDRNGIKIF